MYHNQSVILLKEYKSEYHKLFGDLVTFLPVLDIKWEMQTIQELAESLMSEIDINMIITSQR